MYTKNESLSFHWNRFGRRILESSRHRDGRTSGSRTRFSINCASFHQSREFPINPTSSHQSHKLPAIAQASIHRKLNCATRFHQDFGTPSLVRAQIHQELDFPSIARV